jgi:hypothetical protein
MWKGEIVFTVRALSFAFVFGMMNPSLILCDDVFQEVPLCNYVSKWREQRSTWERLCSFINFLRTYLSQTLWNTRLIYTMPYADLWPKFCFCALSVMVVPSSSCMTPQVSGLFCISRLGSCYDIWNLGTSTIPNWGSHSSLLCGEDISVSRQASYFAVLSVPTSRCI